MNIENEFSTVVKAIGGIRVDELITDAHLTKNADFAFIEECVIAELKCLDVDVMNSESAIKKASSIYDQSMERKQTNCIVFGTEQISSNDVPDDLATKLKSIYREPIRAIAKDASAQIQQTRSRLGINDASGLLLVANNRHTALDPVHAYEILVEILSQPGWYKGINTAVYLTANMPVAHMPSGADVGVWIEIRRENIGIHAVSQCLVNKLRSEWYSHISSITGKPLEFTKQIDQFQLAQLKNHGKT